MWIGIDDTDSPEGGCTTYLTAEIIKRLSDYDVIGYPKLVRLNPNIPWKTRGNGAICIEMGKGKGGRIRIGFSEQKHLFAFTEAQPESKFAPKIEEREKLINILSGIVEDFAEMNDENTNPAVIVFWKKPSRYVYQRVLQKMMTVEDIMKDIYRMGDFASHKEWKNGRGLIGATAACAWEPEDSTYEVITYRHPDKWGTPRNVDFGSASKVEMKIKSTFDNVDIKNKHNCTTPNTPCPILFGIRGDDQTDLLVAKDMIVPNEDIDSWMLYHSNQGTDDHYECFEDIMSLQPYKSVIVRGEVSEEVRTEEGGHTFVTIMDDSGFIDCAAYEPTKEFRDTVRKLQEGDVIVAYGSVREEPFTINLEKFYVESLMESEEKVANPFCEDCQKNMTSMGTGKGYRCRKCKKKVAEEDVPMKPKDRGLKVGFYEVPSCARRHLTKPLKRGDAEIPPPPEC